MVIAAIALAVIAKRSDERPPSAASTSPVRADREPLSPERFAGSRPSVSDATPAASSKPSAKSQVHAIVRRDAPHITNETELAAYLAELERRATRNGRVTALEVQPGFAAITRLQPIIDLDAANEARAQFGSRMTALTERLSPNADDPDRARSESMAMHRPSDD